MSREPRESHKRRSVAVLLLVLALVAAACGGDDEGGATTTDGAPDVTTTDVAPEATTTDVAPEATTTVPAPELKSLSVFAVRDPQIAAQLAVADDQGFFEKYGLEVEARYFSSGSEVAPGFVSGDVQIGMASTMAMIGTLAAGFDATMLGIVSQVAGGIGIVASDEVGFDPANLAGKKLGLINAPPLRILLENFDAEYDSISLDNVELVNFSDPPSMLTAFANGDIDALTIWNPAFLNATEFGNILVSGTTTYIPDGTATPLDLFAVPIGLYTTPTFMEDNPNTLLAVIRAFEDATEWIAENPDQLAQVLSDLLETPLDLTQQMVDQNTYTMVVDQATLDRMRLQTQFVFDLELIPENPDPTDYVDLSLLEQVNAALVQATP